jgi:hypothetical protein
LVKCGGNSVCVARVALKIICYLFYSDLGNKCSDYRHICSNFS